MIELSKIDYSQLDRPEILMFLFHPRPEYGGTVPDGVTDVLIPTEDQVVIGGRFHTGDLAAPSILYFHGNGEVAADYDDMGPLYNRMGINFLPVDYRGYGRSTGQPTITGMMRDSHMIFDFARRWLKENGYTGPFVVMGRSLGSASALELVSHYGDHIDALIVESGFAYAGPLLQLLGVNPDALGFTEEKGFGNLDKIQRYDKPTLVIHAEDDHIIPFSDGQALFDASPAADKRLLPIRGANHNDIFIRGLTEYMSAIQSLTTRLGDVGSF
jgi:fermentation-respiration switch protein FrsA (DUF1100 family)